jgi:hypothetical protein
MPDFVAPSQRAAKRQRRHRARMGNSPLRALLRTLFGRLGRRGSYDVRSPYPIDAVLSKDSQFQSLGLHPRERRAFQKLADRHRYDIFVRTGHISRVANIGRPGLRPKPAGIYQKTSKNTFPGLVTYEQNEASKAQRDLKAIRRADRADAPRGLRVLANEGLRARPLGQGALGVYDGAGNFFYGDIDIHGVYRRVAADCAERVDADTFVSLFNADLVATGLHKASLLEYGTPLTPKEFGVLPYSPIQHGAHDEWQERNDASYASGVNMGPLPGVIHFRPRQQAYHVSTVAQYRDILASFGLERTYTEAAWANGRNRLAAARYTRLHSKRSSDASADACL